MILDEKGQSVENQMTKSRKSRLYYGFGINLKKSTKVLLKTTTK